MDFSLQAIWEHTGLFARFIIFTLGFMSIASLVVMAERMVVFRKTRSDSRNFAAKMGAILAKGDLTTAANTNLGKDVGHLGRVINSGLTAYRISPSNKDVAVESVARALERQAQREVQSMKRGLGVLATVGSTAPFVGSARHDDGYRERLPADGRSGLRRSGHHLGRYRRGAHHHGLRSARGHPRGDGLQLPAGLGGRPLGGHLRVVQRVPGRGGPPA